MKAATLNSFLNKFESIEGNNPFMVKVQGAIVNRDGDYLSKEDERGNLTISFEVAGKVIWSATLSMGFFGPKMKFSGISEQDFIQFVS